MIFKSKNYLMILVAIGFATFIVGCGPATEPHNNHMRSPSTVQTSDTAASSWQLLLDYPQLSQAERSLLVHYVAETPIETLQTEWLPRLRQLPCEDVGPLCAERALVDQVLTDPSLWLQRYHSNGLVLLDDWLELEFAGQMFYVLTLMQLDDATSQLITEHWLMQLYFRMAQEHYEHLELLVDMLDFAIDFLRAPSPSHPMRPDFTRHEQSFFLSELTKTAEYLSAVMPIEPGNLWRETAIGLPDIAMAFHIVSALFRDEVASAIQLYQVQLTSLTSHQQINDFNQLMLSDRILYYPDFEVFLLPAIESMLLLPGHPAEACDDANINWLISRLESTDAHHAIQQLLLSLLVEDLSICADSVLAKLLLSHYSEAVSPQQLVQLALLLEHDDEDDKDTAISSMLYALSSALGPEELLLQLNLLYDAKASELSSQDETQLLLLRSESYHQLKQLPIGDYRRLFELTGDAVYLEDLLAWSFDTQQDLGLASQLLDELRLLGRQGSEDVQNAKLLLTQRLQSTEAAIALAEAYLAEQHALLVEHNLGSFYLEVGRYQDAKAIFLAHRDDERTYTVNTMKNLQLIQVLSDNEATEFPLLDGPLEPEEAFNQHLLHLAWQRKRGSEVQNLPVPEIGLTAERLPVQFTRTQIEKHFADDAEFMDFLYQHFFRQLRPVELVD